MRDFASKAGVVELIALKWRHKYTDRGGFRGAFFRILFCIRMGKNEAQIA